MKNPIVFSPTYRVIALLLILPLLNLIVGCNYYKVTSYQGHQASNQTVDPSRYVILHTPTESFNLQNIAIDKDQQSIHGKRAAITDIHQGHDQPQIKANRYKKKKEHPVNEIHIYTNGVTEDANHNISIDLQDITTINVYDKQVGLTVTSYVFSVLGITAAAWVLIIIIILLTKSSCPFIYIQDGEQFTFKGEIFGGAIAPNLQRHDYMPLKGFQPVDNRYTLRIANELLERQYTDIAKLISVQHPKDVKVLLDQNGQYHSFQNLSTPLKAQTATGNAVEGILDSIDGKWHPFFDESAENPGFSDITLTFEPPTHSEAKLYLSLKNSLWLDFAFGEFVSLFGKNYSKLTEMGADLPESERYQWSKDQGLLLKVEVKQDGKWEVVDHINTVGPLAQRDVVVPISLEGLSNANLEVRLSSGVHFWELDYAAIDYTPNIPLQVLELDVKTAVDQNNQDVSPSLQSLDGEYLAQPNTGDMATLTFQAPEADTTMERSVFLHTFGYYEYIRDYKARTQVKELKRFKEKGQFAVFATEKLKAMASANPLNE